MNWVRQWGILCLVFVVLVGCTDKRVLIQDEAAVRAVKRLAVHPVIVYVRDDEIGKLYNTDNQTLANKTGRVATLDFQQQLQKRVPLRIVPASTLDSFVVFPIPFDSTGWIPKWKTDIDKLPFDAVAFLQLTITTGSNGDNIYATCLVFNTAGTKPILKTKFNTMNGRLYLFEPDISKTAPDAITGITRKLASAWTN